ncbi:hypothetical protein CW362_40980 [Streptomyces populi]|uniref:Uncharacterized protein n=1 Tax=Streptomyces populi TaxID=2058924 RepID=A0A2I0SBN8_9ACTN|nr:hypothetical protein CW362_40980 [Streptomyces populi]
MSGVTRPEGRERRNRYGRGTELGIGVNLPEGDADPAPAVGACGNVETDRAGWPPPRAADGRGRRGGRSAGAVPDGHRPDG